ncbi:uncharacterized protein BP01DRAFT_387556 [Aspergillus saccharolyticus JOP 1030-1]|uniref:RING-type domain-containing protein n=1 Tax=Aspergillus saccharolyticus JOP 1030-1 TaxID=1450539 RepID=A0A318Z9L6_9EURO|nr:hypothetical protein BP01DRAFT_387556 [Aspergillus saccharolyticus JOP 1030-1]PYH40230.1 hypothetical protein BP01DRAFT_387556 [Aspergillus saccharolyticus JOP 1030-1]
MEALLDHASARELEEKYDAHTLDLQAFQTITKRALRRFTHYAIDVKLCWESLQQVQLGRHGSDRSRTEMLELVRRTHSHDLEAVYVSEPEWDMIFHRLEREFCYLIHDFLRTHRDEYKDNALLARFLAVFPIGGTALPADEAVLRAVRAIREDARATYYPLGDSHHPGFLLCVVIDFGQLILLFRCLIADPFAGLIRVLGDPFEWPALQDCWPWTSRVRATNRDPFSEMWMPENLDPAVQTNRREMEPGEACSICRVEFQEEDQAASGIAWCSQCGNNLHSACLYRWLGGAGSWIL